MGHHSLSSTYLTKKSEIPSPVLVNKQATILVSAAFGPHSYERSTADAEELDWHTSSTVC